MTPKQQLVLAAVTRQVTKTLVRQVTADPSTLPAAAFWCSHARTATNLIYTSMDMPGNMPTPAVRAEIDEHMAGVVHDFEAMGFLEKGSLNNEARKGVD